MFDQNFLFEALLGAARSAVAFIGPGAAAGGLVLAAILGLTLGIRALMTVSTAGSDDTATELRRGDAGYEGSYWEYQNGDRKL